MGEDGGECIGKDKREVFGTPSNCLSYIFSFPPTSYSQHNSQRDTPLLKTLKPNEKSPYRTPMVKWVWLAIASHLTS